MLRVFEKKLTDKVFLSELYFFSGNIVLFETLSKDSEEYSSFALKNIPTTVTDPKTNKTIYFIGVVNIKANNKKNQEEILEAMGHYSTIIYRRSTQNWLEIDDLMKNSLLRQENYRIKSCILMYISA